MNGSRISGRILLSLIGGMMFLTGAGTSWLLWQSFSRALQMSHWQEVSCVVVESRVESRRDDPEWPMEMPQEYRFRILYVYEWDGQEYESEQFRLRGAPWETAEELANEKLRENPIGSERKCYVNPRSPEQAVMIKESKAPGYSIWLTVLLAFAGLGIIITAWRQ